MAVRNDLPGTHLRVLAALLQNFYAHMQPPRPNHKERDLCSSKPQGKQTRASKSGRAGTGACEQWGSSRRLRDLPILLVSTHTASPIMDTSCRLKKAAPSKAACPQALLWTVATSRGRPPRPTSGACERVLRACLEPAACACLPAYCLALACYAAAAATAATSPMPRPDSTNRRLLLCRRSCLRGWFSSPPTALRAASPER